MIPADLSARLRLLTEASFFETDPPVSGLARIHAIPSDLPEYAPGQRIQATIQATLPDGSFRALVNGRQLAITLPSPLAPGTEADLEITQTTPSHIHARIASTPEPLAPRPSLSQAGQLIGALLSGQPPQQPTRLAGGQPLVSTPPVTGGDELVPALKEAITQSGLFYESHQARWLAGEITTGQLRREPQGQLPQPPRPAQSHAGTSAGPANEPSAGNPVIQYSAMPRQEGAAARLDLDFLPLHNPVAVTDSVDADLLPPFTAQSPGLSVTSATEGLLPLDQAPPQPPEIKPIPVEEPGLHPSTQASLDRGESSSRTEPLLRETPPAAQPHRPEATGAEPRNLAIPERILPMVSQQLDALATHLFVWQGQVWPGQTMEWEIEDPSARDGGNAEPTEDWNTTLRLTLPSLGGVEARLRLTPAGISVRFLADEAPARQTLGSGSKELAQRLEAAGVPLLGFDVEPGGHG